jgi:hypothetical protein
MSKPEKCTVLIVAGENSFTGAGELCGKKVVAKAMCWRHYRQDLRGRLGSTRPQVEKGEAASVTFNISKTAKAQLQRAARDANMSVGAYLRSLLG